MQQMAPMRNGNPRCSSLFHLMTMAKARLSNNAPAAEPTPSATAVTVYKTATCSGSTKSVMTDWSAGRVQLPRENNRRPVGLS